MARLEKGVASFCPLESEKSKKRTLKSTRLTEQTPPCIVVCYLKNLP